MSGPLRVATRQWCRRRRFAGVAVSVLLALLASGSGRLPMVEAEPSPATVVHQYLRALQARDADTALRYAHAVPLLEGADDLLVPEAMSSSWVANRVVTRYQDPAAALVDVRLAAADGTEREGRFELARSGNGGWTILNPLIKVEFTRLPMRYVELNGAVSQARVVWLFPGAYRAYSGSGLLRVGAPTYVVVPTVRPAVTLDGGRPVAVARFLPSVELTDAGLAELHEQLGGWVDRCAATGQPFPRGCPFAAGDRDEGTLELLDGEFLADGATVSWEVRTYPQIRLVQADGVFTAAPMVPGRLRVSGTAQPRYREGREAFASDCTVQLTDLQVTIPRPGAFRFTIDYYRTPIACDTAQYYD